MKMLRYEPGEDASLAPVNRPITRPVRIKTAVVFLVLLACGVHGPLAVAYDGRGQGPTGADVFLRYCAGCHGFDGFAEYPYAPSFSMGERLQKSDQELLQGVLEGRHAMPYWRDKLSIELFRRAIAYLRTMDQRYRSGLQPREKPLPETYYKFNPVGEEEHYWEYR